MTTVGASCERSVVTATSAACRSWAKEAASSAIAFDDLLETVNDQLWDLTKAVSRGQAHEAAARR